MAIITISRGTFSGGQRVAECIAEKLGYRCINREILTEAASQFNIEENKLYEALKNKPGSLERLYSDRVRYIACIRAALYKEVKDDNVVYHGHAGHLLLKGIDHLIKVRIVADMEFRIEAAMERQHLNREEALAFIKRMDGERTKWTRFLYHVNWNDPSLYDLVLNIDRFNIDHTCDIVCQMAAMERYKTTSESQKAVDDLVLSSNVKAIVATHKEISDGNLDFEANGDLVTIWGTVGSLIDADRVRKITRNVPGVKDIDSKMHVRVPVFSVNGL